jgi:hypothetical protein
MPLSPRTRRRHSVRAHQAPALCPCAPGAGSAGTTTCARRPRRARPAESAGPAPRALPPRPSTAAAAPRRATARGRRPRIVPPPVRRAKTLPLLPAHARTCARETPDIAATRRRAPKNSVAPRESPYAAGAQPASSPPHRAGRAPVSFSIQHARGRAASSRSGASSRQARQAAGRRRPRRGAAAAGGNAPRAAPNRPPLPPRPSAPRRPRSRAGGCRAGGQRARSGALPADLPVTEGLLGASSVARNA